MKNHKSIARSLYLPVLSVFILFMLICINSTPAIAEELIEEEPILLFELETDNGLFYGTKAEGMGWSYDGKYTLTLDGYHGTAVTKNKKTIIPNITVNAKDAVFNIILKGDNYWPGEIWIDYGTLNIAGDGTLLVEKKILINCTSFYNYEDSVEKLPEDQVFNGSLTTELCIVDSNGTAVDLNTLEITEDGMQHYDICGPLKIANPEDFVQAPGKAKFKSIKSPSSEKVTVKIKNPDTVSGFELLYSTDKKFESEVTTLNISGNKSIITKKIGKFSSGKKYYFKTRAYNTAPDGTKIYGKFSSVKSVSVK